MVSGVTKDAALAMRQAYELNPNDPLVQRDYAFITLRTEGKLDEATRILTRILRVNPTQNQHVNSRLGDCSLSNGEFAKAAKYYEQEKLRPPNLRARLVAALYLSGEKDRARNAAEDLRKINPDFSAQTLLGAIPLIGKSKWARQVTAALVAAGAPRGQIKEDPMK